MNGVQVSLDHESRSGDSSLELTHVRVACARLEALAAHGGPIGAGQFHRVVSLIHDICVALTEAEDAGVEPVLLRTAVAGARAVHAQSPFIRRLQEWPRGYPGDFETIEWLWRGKNHATPGSLAYVFETYALSASIAQQHRNKVALQTAAIRQAAYANAEAHVLSIGCGSNPDVRSVIDEVGSGARFTLCDSDVDALEFSRGALAPFDDRCRFVLGMVPRVLRYARPDAPFAVILAGGLFDYLSDRFIVRTLREAWHDLLAPGGTMLFTNIAAGNPFRVWLEYLANWRLIERSEEDVERLCREAEIPVAPALTRDSTGLAIVATLKKA
jgi:SAM-dependent methyltransferase